MSNTASILNIGRLALLAAQTQITATSNNIANSGTVGYSRQSVTLQETTPVDTGIGQLGTGVNATEIVRSFDDMIEKLYNQKSADASRWTTAYSSLQNIESLFTETDTSGNSANLSAFWNAWQALTTNPDDEGTRSSLLAKTSTLVQGLNNTYSDMDDLRTLTDSYISEDVDKVNSLCRQIVNVNRQIAGKANQNTLLDQRDQLVRQLAEIVDIKTYNDTSTGNMTITTTAGQTLVSGTEYPDPSDGTVLKYEGPKSQSSLMANSTFNGSIYFEGSSSNEFTIEVVSGGSVDGSSTAAQFKVSLDGGKTWLTSASGNVRLFSARPEDQMVQVDDLKIWFGQKNSEGTAPTTDLTTGDRFTITPKNGIYWYSTTSSSVNITTQIMGDGQDNTSRITGGSLAGYLQVRDYYVGNYEDKLNEFTQELIWNVNRLHSQGAGLDDLGSVTGTYAVSNDNYALGSDSSGLAFGNKLTAGNVTMYFYDTNGNLVSSGGIDFDSSTPGIQNFDPTKHSLASCAAAINNTFGTYVTASVVNHKLVINSKSGYQFGFGADSSGLLAGLGINTYFDGYDAATIKVNPLVQNNLNYINAGHVNGEGEMNSGDYTTASAITSLQSKTLTFHTNAEGTTTQTLGDYYASLVTNVGADTSVAEFNSTYHTALATDLNNRQQEVSGVNLDEELSNLIKYQHAYTAAAKLITTSDQMMNILLSLKS